ncbi:MAG: MotA/TolQ/ExbB proton channel family protein [Melioribacteraceae bacterium]|nr:MotA/TolQ/ExbB proton channel family protein [Melioribacteraceae bacterium]MCF8354592.1 MotA/TolQ/ExbB proton channel family protein [Melioribacteraceae bacterium]MCF8394944.1 MotA/TolQ/ExbB proton channel family protein [Melioribacteraceae bacterium]MCF8420169.1 MotA/TolQ/ExbB proton channel family protein [Melioribacteraceae bacterium]
MDLFTILLKGGWVLLPILIASIVAVAIIVDRYLVLRKSKMNVPAFLVKIRSILKKKDINAAMQFCRDDKSPTANIVRKGLKKYRFGHERVKEAIESAGRQEISKLERGLSVLATISGVAPLLGFLGTVTGMISAFMKIEDLQGAANPSDLAGGIWEALLTTAFGLAVGIVAFTFYNYLVSSINKLVLDMEVISNDVVDQLEEMQKNYPSEEEIETEL